MIRRDRPAAAAALAFALLARIAVSTESGSGSDSAAALAKLRTLAGDWSGTVEWTGARTDRGTMKVSYRLTGYGSAVVEDLSSEGGGGVPAMTSVYHQDGADLRVTHYCGAQNQPRLKASRMDVAAGAFDFAFVDATNLKTPDAPHVTGIELRLGDSEHMVLTFVFAESGGRVSREKITLTRVGKG